MIVRAVILNSILVLNLERFWHYLVVSLIGRIVAKIAFRFACVIFERCTALVGMGLIVSMRPFKFYLSGVEPIGLYACG